MPACEAENQGEGRCDQEEKEWVYRFRPDSNNRLLQREGVEIRSVRKIAAFPDTVEADRLIKSCPEQNVGASDWKEWSPRERDDAGTPEGEEANDTPCSRIADSIAMEISHDTGEIHWREVGAMR